MSVDGRGYLTRRNSHHFSLSGGCAEMCGLVQGRVVTWVGRMCETSLVRRSVLTLVLGCCDGGGRGGETLLNCLAY